ncbi:uncharacterized protein LOC142239771 [Haematobia irritans]|uniref:uncharacterized protein LOC142239771 n=1 Tax=Haematobia irritans TaxID=7368 RepID=UPI003F509BEF
MSVSVVKRFIRISDALIKFHAHFNDVFSLEIRQVELGKLWGRVQNTYEECLAALQDSGDTPSSDIDSVEGKYETSHEVYMNCLSAINRRLAQSRRSRRSSISSSVTSVATVSRQSIGSHKSGERSEAVLINNASSSVTANWDETVLRNGNEKFGGEVAVGGPPLGDMVHNLTLPPCDTDIFEGNFLSWPTFRDLFQAVYVNNSRLTDVERLCHLVRKTSGEAREIVSKFPLTHRSFALAWKALVDAYDNKRVLVHNQLKSLFAISAVTVETSSALKSIQRGMEGCLSALNTYEVSTDNWDQILVFICLQRLPRITQTLWEQSVRDKSALSSWNELDSFLTERVRTLMCLHDRREEKSHSKDQKVKTHLASTVTPQPGLSSKSACILCPKHSHKLSACQKFRKLSPAERFSSIKRHRLCLNCLVKGHEAKDCTSKHRCSKCDQRHHSLLHRDGLASARSDLAAAASTNVSGTGQSLQPSDPSPLSFQPTSTSTSSGVVSRQVFHLSQNRSVLLGTAMINIVHQGVTYPARALIDPASEASFITERLQNRLKLEVQTTRVTISGVNSAVSATSNRLCTLKIGSPLDASILLETTAWLADANLFVSRPVEVLLGADLYSKILLEGCLQITSASLLAQKSIFGWLVTGPIPVAQVRSFSTTISVRNGDDIEKTLLRFWELEETPLGKSLSPSDRFREENYVRTTRRDSDGRYIVTLPLKADFSADGYLGESRASVLRQYIRNETSLLRKPDIKVVYDNVVREYLELDHMRPVSSTVSQGTLSCYLPHHPVINLAKQSIKLRVIFNASNKTSNGNSLNDILHVGPTLQLDLVLLILRWRLYKFVFNCDITQMYRQIRVDPAHTPLQRILYRDSPDGTIRDYELQTVTFGVNCVPYLAIRTLLQLADDTEDRCPLAAHILRKSMYVDDVLSGGHDLESALAVRDQLVAALSTAKFELRKWTANDRALLDGLPLEYLVDVQVSSFVEASSSKPLGIRWNAQLDSFYFSVDPINSRSHFTKREVLSAIARLFDPVGWLGPVIVTAKIIMQKVWSDNIGWDEFLSPSTERAWKSFVELYPGVNSISIPRWVQYVSGASTELHVFSDASEKAYAGVVYIRIVTPDGRILDLELCGAVLASELLKTIVREIGIGLGQVYCWTDSTIVLSWLRKTPSTWTTFVANRVCRIQENVGHGNWYHVRSEDNPADLGSRGVTPADLAASRIWWHGPHWLSRDSSEWSIRDLAQCETDLEVRPIRSYASFFSAGEDILECFSSLDRALRVVS